LTLTSIIKSYWYLKYLLDLQIFVDDKFPEDGTLLPKHVAVGTWYEVFCDPVYCILISVFVYFQLRTAAFKAYCVIWVRRSNFRHQASPRLSPRESTQRRKVELWTRKSGNFAWISIYTLHLGIFYMP
jgi:hypothetical protein